MKGENRVVSRSTRGATAEVLVQLRVTGSALSSSRIMRKPSGDNRGNGSQTAKSQIRSAYFACGEDWSAAKPRLLNPRVRTSSCETEYELDVIARTKMHEQSSIFFIAESTTSLAILLG
eukprot:scaffold84076_cov47-Prasinocladus_malaysianus.AAC.1